MCIFIRNFSIQSFDSKKRKFLSEFETRSQQSFVLKVNSENKISSLIFIEK